eukprot:PITA_30146
MLTFLIGKELWEIVELRYEERVDWNALIANEITKRKEERKKNAQALFHIQVALDKSLFPRISGAKTTKAAWETLQEAYQVGETISNEVLIKKVLRYLTHTWNHVAIIMEESKDLKKLQFDQLVGSLMSHEERLKDTFEGVEKAFSFKLQITKNEDASSSSTKINQGQGKWKSQNYSRGRGRGGSIGRGSFRGRGRGRFDKRNVQCYYYNRYGHFERECRLKEGKYANYAQESGEYPPDHLFLSYAKGENIGKDVWHLDSGCSNHMTGNEKLFSAKDGNFKSKI